MSEPANADHGTHDAPKNVSKIAAPSCEVRWREVPFPVSPGVAAKNEPVKYGFQPASKFGCPRVSAKGKYWMVGDESSMDS